MKNAENLFWTGGFDSTFRLTQLVLLGRPVNLFYMTGQVDGCTGRQSVAKEIETMKKILKKLERYSPTLQLHIINVTGTIIDEDIKNIHRRAYEEGFFSRPINQYAYAAQIARNNHFIGEVCVVNDGDMNGSYGLLSRHNPYKDLSFPIINLSKNEMMAIAKENGFDDILKMTWSCWYPTNGRPCGRCEMCLGRIKV